MTPFLLTVQLWSSGAGTVCAVGIWERLEFLLTVTRDLFQKSGIWKWTRTWVLVLDVGV
jgi:hypothetical protein